jgi:peptidoglycan hydrolase-like protein with peptidoglycan-binding domain
VRRCFSAALQRLPSWRIIQRHDLGYNSYPYDGPIYGYGNLVPGQVIVNVQSALQQQGYYRGAVDGALGPMTRSAIANFQSDHGLAVTAAIDQPTLATFGLV